MSTSFIHRNPTKNETQLLRLAISTFCDGSGQESESNGGTRPGWRDFERSIAEVMGGRASESKELFDVVVPSASDENTYFGLSIKSKQLARKTAVADLESGGRVHLEVANSPAKFWYALSSVGLTEQDFKEQKNPKLFGETVLDVVEQWHTAAAQKFDEMHRDKRLDLDKSVYLVISYNKPAANLARTYQIHSFPLQFPKNIKWEFISSKCLRGYDPKDPTSTLVDWYALSGGQLKYYPSTKDALYASEQFELALPPHLSILDKVKTYWPKEASEIGLK